MQRHCPEVNEAEFLDRIAECLWSRDVLLIIAGDGIRSDVQALTEQVNQGSGLSARLALVELQLWSDGRGKTLVVPSLPLRTEVIRQRIVVTPDRRPVALEPEDAASAADPRAEGAMLPEQLRLGPRDADGADENPETVLLMGEHMLDLGADGRLGSIGLCGRHRHRFTLGLAPVDATGQHPIGQPGLVAPRST